eukprot:gene7275-11593_t
MFNSRHSVGVEDTDFPEIKILVIGCRSSGKSTVLKQFRFLQEEVNARVEFKNQEQRIIANLMKITNEFYLRLESDGLIENKILVENRKKFCDHLTKEKQFNDKEIGEFFFALWKEKYEEKILDQVIRDSHLQHNIKKILKKMLDLEEKWRIYQQNCQENDSITEFYKINKEDFLNVQCETTGVVEVLSMKLNSNGINFNGRFYEGGGQRSIMKKWSRYFEDMHLFLFFVPLSEYDQKCYEDDTKNRLIQSLETFKMLIDSKNENNIGNKRLILVFTKIDIFLYKIEKYENLIEFFPDYKGNADNVTEGVRFIQKKFFTIYQKCLKSKDLNDIVISSMEEKEAERLLILVEKNLKFFQNSDQ